ncbi:MAG: hypothetical protein WA584_19825 [Pyrinomonadaceae bacterium]
MKYLVLLETSGNQRYIFSTNKLRENVGASELTYQIGTKAVMKAIGKYDIVKDDKDGKKLISFLFNSTQNPPIETQNDDGVEIVMATSGKALILTKTFDKAKEIVRKVTQAALETIPGLTVHGAICKVKDCEKVDESDEADRLHEAVGDVHKKLEEIRYQIPSNLQRFQRLPFVAECNSSNLPAEKLYIHESVKGKEAEKPHSIVSITKQENLKKGKTRLENSVKTHETDLHFADNINALEKHFKETNWLAVIHSDGNGLGQIFLDFQQHIKAEDGNEYREKYRKFSLGLDECTIKATAFALKNLQTAYRANRKDKDKDSIEVPAIPLVLGGDDLTIICDGQYAIKFTKDFLNKFVEETKNPKIQDIFPNGISLGICAGIAIIKPHYPFHQAYRLAEQLLQSAKKSKEVSVALSALDYHVLYDLGSVDLAEIRGKLKHFKVARPYIVSDEPEKIIEKLSEEERELAKVWVDNHHFNKLSIRVETMRQEEDGKRKLPNSQLHTLRERLHLGTAEADAFAKTITHRYDNTEKKDEPFKKLYVEKETLFFEEDGADGKHKLTHFLDAMEIAEFWKGFENGGENER